MKRLIRHAKAIIQYEFDIDIVSSSYMNLFATTNPDLTGTEYDEFIINMISQFKKKGYSLSRDENYTHASNFPGSLSEYYTFTKWVDDVQIIVLVSVRISDHPDVPRRGMSPEEKRTNYANRLGEEFANRSGASDYHSKILDIVFDGQHIMSFSSAELKINSRLNTIEKQVAEMIETNNFTDGE